MEIGRRTSAINQSGLMNIAKTTNNLRNINVDNASISVGSTGLFMHPVKRDQEKEIMPFTVERDWINTKANSSGFKVHAGVVAFDSLGNHADLPMEVNGGETSKDCTNVKSIAFTPSDDDGKWYIVAKPDHPVTPSKITIEKTQSLSPYNALTNVTSITYDSNDISTSRTQIVLAELEWHKANSVATNLQQIVCGWQTLGDKAATRNHAVEGYTVGKILLHGGKWYWSLNGENKTLDNAAGNMDIWSQTTAINLNDGNNYISALLDDRYNPTSFTVENYVAPYSPEDGYPPEKCDIALVVYSAATKKITSISQFVCGDIKTSYSWADSYSVQKRTDGENRGKYQLHGWLEASEANASSIALIDVIPFKEGAGGDGVDTQYATVKSIVDLANAGAAQYIANVFCDILDTTTCDICQWIEDNCDFDIGPHSVLSDLVAGTGTDDHVFSGDISLGNYSYLSNQGNASRNRGYELGDSDGLVSISMDNRYLCANSTSVTLDWDLETILHNGNIVVDWGLQSLNDQGGSTSINWDARTAIDNGGDESIDWDNRTLSNSSGKVIDWSTSPVEISAKVKVLDDTAGSFGSAGSIQSAGGAFLKKKIWVDSGGAHINYDFGSMHNPYARIGDDSNQAALFANDDMSTSVLILSSSDGLAIYAMGANSLIKSDVGYQTFNYVGSTKDSDVNLVTNDGTLIPCTIRGGLVVIT